MKQGEQSGNLSGFYSWGLASEDATLEVEWKGKWRTYSEMIEATHMINIEFLAEKDWSIRKRKSELDKAVKDLGTIMYDPSSKNLIDARTILSKYIIN